MWLLKEMWRGILDIVEVLFLRPEEAPSHPMNSITPDPDALFPWDTEEHCHHNVRAMCDLADLSYTPTVPVVMPDGTTKHWSEKDIFSACVYQESGFKPSAQHKNADGTIDFGICQFNNGKNSHGVPFWIGEGAAFPSTEYVLEHPDACVREMLKQFKAGNLRLWASYSTGAYKQWLGKV